MTLTHDQLDEAIAAYFASRDGILIGDYVLLATTINDKDMYVAEGTGSLITHLGLTTMYEHDLASTVQEA